MSTKPPSPFASRGVRRRPVLVEQDRLVRIEPLTENGTLPMVVRPAFPRVNLIEWAKANREELDGRLLRHGALLFRGFAVDSLELFQAFAEATSEQGLADYRYGSTPRKRIQGGVFTSTEYPADQAIPMHNEMSYTRSWPRRIWFYCQQSAAHGGATPIADSTAVFEAIRPSVRERFAEHGVLYVRNYGRGFDLPYEQVFGTSDLDEIARFCRQARIEMEIGKDGNLRTRQICQAVATHPETGRMLWFNQAHLFHVSSAGPALAEALLERFGEQGLPRHAFYGDGEPIEAQALAEIRNAYRETSIAFPWEEGDLLMVDNMAIAHGREPYSGERRIAVTMAEPYVPDALAPGPTWMPQGFVAQAQ